MAKRGAGGKKADAENDPDREKTRLVQRGTPSPPGREDDAGIEGNTGVAGGGHPEPSVDDEKTRLARSGSTLDYDTRGRQFHIQSSDDALIDDPVVGWLVVVEGPGRGRAIALGYGMSSIGRSPDERICLDFGDEQISRENHAVVTYDTRGRKFYVQHGGGKNLTYLGDEPVLSPAELKAGDEISLGNSKLRFIPLCGPDFEW